MPSRFPWIAALLLLAAGGGALFAHGAAGARECPAEEKRLVWRNLTSPVSGDLVADVRSEAWLTYRACELAHVAPVKTSVKFRSQAGAYHLVVHGADFRDAYLLRPGDPAFRENETRAYNVTAIVRLAYTGVAHDGEISSNEIPRPTPEGPSRKGGDGRAASPWTLPPRLSRGG